jgi:hypothetical protein
VLFVRRLAQATSVAQCGIGRFCGLAAAFDDLGLHPGEGFNFVVFHGQTLPRISDAFNRWQPDRATNALTVHGARPIGWLWPTLPIGPMTHRAP